MTNPPPVAKRRRWWQAAAALPLALLLLVGALPWLLSTPPSRRWLLGRVNQTLAPGRLEMASVRFSWFGPTRIIGLALIDHEGDRVVYAPRARWDRTLWQVVCDRPRYGTLTVDDGAFDVERRADGTVDVYETIQPLLRRDPRLDLKVNVASGRLRFRSAGMPEPVLADRVDFAVHLAPSPHPLTWRLNLARDRGGDPPATLAVSGEYERWRVEPEGTSVVTADVRADRWPWSLERSEVRATGTLRGQLAFERRSGRWAARAVDCDELTVALVPARRAGVAAPIRFATRARFDPDKGDLILTPLPSGAGPEALTLTPEGVRVSGIGKPGALRVDAGFSGAIGGLVALVAPGAGEYGGSWSVQATVQPAAEGLRFDARLDVRDLTLPPSGAETGKPRRVEGAIGLALKGLWPTGTEEVELSELVATTPFATAHASGRFTDPAGRRLFALQGTLHPNWELLNRLITDRIDRNARLDGRPRPLRLSGSLGGGSPSEVWKSVEAEVGFDLVEADFFGLKVGKTPVVLRLHDGQIACDPIDAELNEGRLHLEPVLALDAPEGPAVRLGPRSFLKDAVLNDEVSHRVLSYVAPILDQATRARGRVSVALDEAVFPIGPRADRRQLSVVGNVAFQDVEFAPGPFANQVLGLVVRDRRLSVQLNDPVNLTIADGRVMQSGLAIPLGNLTHIELSGWVDFDRNIDMRATVPVPPALVGKLGFAGRLIEGTRISIPIRGTLRKPRIEGGGAGAGFKELGQSLSQTGAGVFRGASELFRRMTRRAAPVAPAPSP